ncbi:hypothetical protein CPB84DRAFT_1847439 [Gymnopilus junonius]|uniref:Zinc finger PHD-type domain-containing protein n=1 Tax=Gymnopilus junonius TaxID=109634 RepID=A0A9P5TNH1_GYMJU|nr:hypothetical protein CPB84DRAFT_1847439 [Gymnopilus junonius]
MKSDDELASWAVLSPVGYDSKSNAYWFLAEVQRKLDLEDALVHRKRSSRIALKESEREEARLTARRKQEEEEKQSRAKRLEARLKKEEAERIKRENAREQRRKERETREESRKTSAAPEVEQGVHLDKKKRASPSGSMRSKDKVNNGGSRAVATDDWELSCEICERHGLNLDDGTPMMSCGHCFKWQHILCHDRADRAAGRPPRNWDAVDFICRKCRASRQDNYNDRIFSLGEHHSVAQASQLSAFNPYQSVMMPSADREHSYMPNFREPNHQSFYIRPTNGHPHYQPAAHSFSGHKFYPESQPHYSHASSQYGSTPQPHKPQTIVPGWNNPAQLHSTGYSPQNGYPTAPHPVNLRGLQGEHPVPDHTSQALHRYPEARYPPPQYLSSQYRYHSASYQPPLDRQ